jgi:hypothetical protein
MSDKIDVLQFMVVRAPQTPAPSLALRGYVRDDLVTIEGRRDADLFSTQSASSVGRDVYDAVFCGPDESSSPAKIAELLDRLSGLLVSYRPPCPNTGDGLGLEPLQSRTSFVRDGTYYLLPDRLQDLAAPMAEALPRLEAVLAEAAALKNANGNDSDLDVEALRAGLRRQFDDIHLYSAVFSDTGYSRGFGLTKRALFDALYLLYVFRRRASVNLEYVMNGLRALHALEALAVDELLTKLQVDKPDPLEAAILAVLSATYPSLRNTRVGDLPGGFPLIARRADLETYLSATPVVHPIFARLHRFRRPFNDVAPIGIGDLKVVKHWLRGYKLGEISHIDNVLLGELKSKVHRQLEKSEEVLSFSSQQQNETSRDTQTTDRFEIKREAESLLKTDLAVNAGLNVNATYQGTGYTIVAGVTGGFAYTRSQTEQAKLSGNYAREVVDKAVKRVQSQVNQTRTTTTVLETEETNTHTLDNKQGSKHVSGLYHWLDKEYRARVYNYGKRLMFEFVLPEPAAFLVESRLRAYETDVDVPAPPQPPTYVTLPDAVSKLKAEDITEDKFRELGSRYDLSEFTYPQTSKRVEFVDTATGRNYFSEDWADSSTWQGRSYTCRLNAKDYRISKLTLEGFVHFWGANEGGGSPKPPDVNTLELYVDGHQYLQLVNNKDELWYFGPKLGTDFLFSGTPALSDGQVPVFFGFWDIAEFDVSLHADLELSAGVLKNWQTLVVNKVRSLEQARVDAQNDDLRQSYESRLSTYHNRLAELRATAVNDLLQGQSEAYNRRVILRELKRQALAAITKEFDDDPADDALADLEAMGTRSVDVEYRRLKVDELPDASQPSSVSVGFSVEHKQVDFPAPDLPSARVKGRYVQFLEQAFEWQQLAYICYPYFWATPPKWVELMNRSDDADPFLTEFLQAGSARVLVAVTPAYDEAVLHYLATGEPWDGGPAPVIGDPLYIPLYEELRRQQDDLANATPEGDPWSFTLPTSLVYLKDSSTPLPPMDDSD